MGYVMTTEQPASEVRQERRVRQRRRGEDLLNAKQASQGRLFRALINSTPDGIVGLSLDGQILSWSRGAEELLGYNEHEVVGLPIGRLLQFEAAWWVGGVNHWEGALSRRDGHRLHVAIDSSPVQDEVWHATLGFAWLIRDITAQVHSAAALRAHQARLQEEARTDPLTGVANRRRLEEVLNSEISRARRHETSLSLLLVDVDHFKHINDNHSHAAGDAALKAVATTIQAGLRACDLLGRLGGDEFVILMPDTGRGEARACAERVRAELSRLDVSGLPNKLTASFGIAEYQHGESAETLMARADKALYEAKQGGRDCAVHWEDIAEPR